MGGDGGSIPTRVDLVRTKQKSQQLEKDMEAYIQWKLCALSERPLNEPIVACELGCLYNKDAILEYLIDKATIKDTVKHIRSLKDVKELTLTKNRAFIDKADKGDEYKDMNASQFVCPLVGVEMNGKYRFCFVWTCGCVMSERALKELKSNTCHQCGKAFEDADVIVLNGTPDEKEQYKKRMEDRRLQIRLAKKAKTEGPSSVAPGASSVGKYLKRTSDTRDRDHPAANLGEKSQSKKPKTVQDDARASSAYKSLFTSSEEAQKQQRAHWVTYNPFYN